MTVSLSVRRDMDDLRTLMFHDRAPEPVHEKLRIKEQIIEPDRLGNRAVIEKDIDGKRRIIFEKVAIRLFRIDASPRHILPGPPSSGRDGLGLMR